MKFRNSQTFAVDLSRKFERKMAETEQNYTDQQEKNDLLKAAIGIESRKDEEGFIDHYAETGQSYMEFVVETAEKLQEEFSQEIANLQDSRKDYEEFIEEKINKLKN